MSNDERSERVDELLELLSKPLTRYILSVIAGIDPGVYVENSENDQVSSQNRENDDS